MVENFIVAHPDFSFWFMMIIALSMAIANGVLLGRMSERNIRVDAYFKSIKNRR